MRSGISEVPSKTGIRIHAHRLLGSVGTVFLEILIDIYSDWFLCVHVLTPTGLKLVN